MTPSEHLIQRLGAIEGDPSVHPTHRKTASDAGLALRLALNVMPDATEEMRRVREQQADLHRRLVERLLS